MPGQRRAKRQRKIRKVSNFNIIGREGSVDCVDKITVNCSLCIYKRISFPEDPYEKKLGTSFYRKIRKEGEDVYDGIATSLGMWDKMEYNATYEYLKQNGGFTPVPVSSIVLALFEHRVSIMKISNILV